MQMHALALARSGVQVRLVGCPGTPVFPAVEVHPRISVRFIGGRRQAAGQRTNWFLLRAMLRAGAQAMRLLGALLFPGARPDIILVQNPPSIPTLVIALAAARIRRARLVIDWHNFGWAMLGLKIGDGHPIVRLARRYEWNIGRRAELHFCVSKAMAAALLAEGAVERAIVLCDAPPEILPPTTFSQRRKGLMRFAHQLDLADVLLVSPNIPVLVSGTSWSLDEDFAVLLEAIESYDQAADEASLPPLAIVITGRGPLRAEFEQMAAGLELMHVHLRTAWLSEPDYRLLLAAADLGLSFHRSASGVDLAMKVADMQGAGLPVCALDYGPCLGEQIQHGENGLVFPDGAALAKQLATLLTGFPAATAELENLRAGVRKTHSITWEENWRRVAKSVILGH